jgi:cyclopropane fatty-acyl-phospholipid synthase-like methyltransferase
MIKPDPEIIAAQLRCPHGELANEVAFFMSKSNDAIYNLAITYLVLNGGESLLEIGPADGFFVQKLLAKNIGRYTGVDMSMDMVNAAKERYKEIEHRKVDFIHAEINSYVSAEKYDRILAVNTLYFFEDAMETMRHIHSLLNSNGKFVLAFRSAETMKNLPFTRFGFTLYTAEEVGKMLQLAGFSKVIMNTENEEISTPEGEKLILTNVCAIASH